MPGVTWACVILGQELGTTRSKEPTGEANAPLTLVIHSNAGAAFSTLTQLIKQQRVVPLLDCFHEEEVSRTHPDSMQSATQGAPPHAVRVRATNRATIVGLMQSDMIDVTVIARHPMWNPAETESDFDLAALLLATPPSASVAPLQRTLPANPLGQSLLARG